MEAEGIVSTDPAVVGPPSLVCGLQKTWVNLWLIPSDAWALMLLQLHLSHQRCVSLGAVPGLIRKDLALL